MAQREQALKLLLVGPSQVSDSDNPLYKQVSKHRTLAQAEKTLKKAAAAIDLRLR